MYGHQAKSFVLRMLALFLMLSKTYYAQNKVGIIGLCLNMAKVMLLHMYV